MKMANMLQIQENGVIVQDIVLLNLEKVRTETHFSKNSLTAFSCFLKNSFFTNL